MNNNYIRNVVTTLSAALQRELLDKKVISYYTEWCSTPKPVEDGVAFKDSCISFTEGGSMTSTEKSRDADVYVYISVSLKDPILVATEARLEQFLEQTIWNNKNGMQVCFAAMVLVLQNQNVDPCFCTLGRHGFLDTNIFIISDDELRKQGELLVKMLVVTGQEAVEGSKQGVREDPADPNAARLPFTASSLAWWNCVVGKG